MEACNLGSINLAKFVNPGRIPAIDYNELRETVKLPSASWTTPSIVPLPHAGNRRDGQGQPQDRAGRHGVCRHALPVGDPYNSEEALEKAEERSWHRPGKAREASRLLAEKRGPFPNFDKSIFKGVKRFQLRNATTTTIAPTGTLSIIAGCSSGIEPLFALSFVQKCHGQ
jgi:ribonucleoside-diphosphate reductase alpha chain